MAPRYGPLLRRATHNIQRLVLCLFSWNRYGRSALQMTVPSEPAPAEQSPFEVSEQEVEEALAACDGDPRATIRALLVGQAFLEHQMSQIQADASAGFRRRHSAGTRR